MRPAVVTAALLLGVLLCEVGSTYGRTMADICARYPRRSCGRGWERLDENRCMKLFWSKRNFYRAESKCRKYRGHLVSLHSAAQKNRLSCLVWRSGTSNYKVWIGAKRYYRAGKYYYTDRSPMDYTNWYPGLNQNRGSNRCVESNYKVWGRWHNAWCSEEKHFVCTKQV